MQNNSQSNKSKKRLVVHLVVLRRLHRVLRYAENNRLSILIAADTNSHSSLFGPSTNKRGEQIELFIAKYKLTVENNSHIPTYESRGAETCVDVTLTAKLGDSVMDWEVNRNYNGSDHNSIEYKMLVDKIKVEPQWLWAKADWDIFATEITKHLQTEPKFILDQEECDNMVNHLYNTINKALKVAVPKSKPKIVDKNNPWWNSYLSKQRRKLDTLFL